MKHHLVQLVLLILFCLVVSHAVGAVTTTTAGTVDGAIFASESATEHSIMNISHSFVSSGFTVLTGNGQAQLAMSLTSEPFPGSTGLPIDTKRALEFNGTNGAGASLDEDYMIAKMGYIGEVPSTLGVDPICMFDEIPSELGSPGTAFNNMISGEAKGVLYNGAYGSTNQMYVTPQSGSSVNFAGGVTGTGIFTFSNGIFEQGGVPITTMLPDNSTVTTFQLNGESSYQKSVTFIGDFDIAHTFNYQGV